MSTKPRRLTRATALLAVSLSLLLSAVGGVGAVVTFDPATGTGIVGKAEILQALGWSERTFQANARKLAFHAVHHVSWTWTCVIEDEPITLSADEESSRAVDAVALTSSQRKSRSVTGFELTGYAGSAPEPPTSPASCPSDEPPSDVTLAVSDILYVDARGRSEPV